MMPSDPVLGGVVLRRPAEQSPNYVQGVSGWTINADGTVEFNNGVFRGTISAGTFEGPNFVFNGTGEFFYSGAPAAGNLIYSVVGGSVVVTDPSGNQAFPGATSYSGPVSTGGSLAVQTFNGAVTFWQASGGTWIQQQQFANASIWLDMRPLQNGFVGTIANEYPPQFRRNASGRVELSGTVQLPGGAAVYNQVTFATLPAGFRPTKASALQRYAIAGNFNAGTALTQSPRIQCDTSGNLQFAGLPGAINGANIFINGEFPLDSTGLIQS